MKKIRLFLTFFTLTLFITLDSCTNEKESPNSNNFNSAIREAQLENLGQQLDEFWLYAFNTYTMDVVCSCTCEDVERMPEIWENGIHLLPEFLNNSSLNINTCNEIKHYIKQECLHQNYEQFRQYAINLINSKYYFSPEERNIIYALITSLEINNFSEENIVSSWENLPLNPLTNNEVSLYFIQTSLSIINFHKNNPNIFGSENDSAILHHVISAVVGGILGAELDALEDVWFNTGWGNNPAKDFKKSFIKGAIAGAIASV